MNATNDSTTIRTYFFNKTNKQCGQPKVSNMIDLSNCSYIMFQSSATAIDIPK